MYFFERHAAVLFCECTSQQQMGSPESPDRAAATGKESRRHVAQPENIYMRPLHACYSMLALLVHLQIYFVGGIISTLVAHIKESQHRAKKPRGWRTFLCHLSMNALIMHLQINFTNFLESPDRVSKTPTPSTI